jgi:multicomponent Na+:H+ antiporter subunit D
VLDGAGLAPASRSGAPAAPQEAGTLLAWIMVAAALAVAGFSLFRDHLPAFFVRLVDLVLGPFAAAVERMHNGLIGDYAVWMLLGLTLFGGTFLLR